MITVALNAEDINRAMTRIAHEILEKNKGSKNLAIVGIRTRGVYIAKRLIKKLNEIENIDLPLGILDITLYRDDLGTGIQNPVLKKNRYPLPHR